MRYILLSITLLLSIGISFAQEQKSLEKDRVIYRNYSQLEGEIIEVSKRWVVIKVGAVPFSVRKEKIASIYYQGEVISFLDGGKEKTGKNIKKSDLPDVQGYRLVPIKNPVIRGFYNVAYATLHLPSIGDFGNNDLGFGISNTVGYQFNRYTGVGLGLGYHDTDFFNRGSIVPVYAEYRGYLSDKKVSAYYSLAYGLSFGTKNEDSNYSSTKPGSYFYPALGFKSGSNEASFMIDIGVRFSEVTYIFDQGIRTTTGEETIFSRGLILRIGVML